MKKMLASFGIALMVSCNSQKADHQESHSATDSVPVAGASIPGKSAPLFKITGDSVEIPSFEIEVQLSPAAEEKLKHDHETVIVSAMFSGIPKDTTIEEYREEGGMSVANYQVELKDERIAKFAGLRFSRKTYDSLADKDIMLLINIYSGRRASQDNILDCRILEDNISAIQGHRFAIKGKLIGEPDSN